MPLINDDFVLKNGVLLLRNLRYVLERLGPWFCVGTVIVFDEVSRSRSRILTTMSMPMSGNDFC